MGMPLDDDFNYDIKPGEPKAVKGGTFAPSDIPVIKRALQVYLLDCMRTEGYSEREPHPDVAPIANLLHRLGRIA